MPKAQISVNELAIPVNSLLFANLLRRDCDKYDKCIDSLRKYKLIFYIAFHIDILTIFPNFCLVSVDIFLIPSITSKQTNKLKYKQHPKKKTAEAKQ